MGIYSAQSIEGRGVTTITYEQGRTETERQIDAVILERVRRGLKWLEETHGPGWEDKSHGDQLQAAWEQALRPRVSQVA